MSNYNDILVDHVMKNYIGYISAKKLLLTGGILRIDDNTHEYYGSRTSDYLTLHTLNSVSDDELVVVIKKDNVRHVVTYNINKLK